MFSQMCSSFDKYDIVLSWDHVNDLLLVGPSYFTQHSKVYALILLHSEPLCCFWSLLPVNAFFSWYGMNGRQRQHWLSVSTYMSACFLSVSEQQQNERFTGQLLYHTYMIWIACCSCGLRDLHSAELGFNNTISTCNSNTDGDGKVWLIFLGRCISFKQCVDVLSLHFKGCETDHETTKGS